MGRGRVRRVLGGGRNPGEPERAADAAQMRAKVGVGWAWGRVWKGEGMGRTGQAAAIWLELNTESGEPKLCHIQLVTQ